MEKFFNLVKTKAQILLFPVLLIAIVGFGIYLRLCEYLLNRSIWLDEASLALNVMGKSFYGLLTQPLDYNQAAPIGFLLLTKILVTVFGKSEFVFRFIPLISSLVSFIVLYKLSVKFIPRKYSLFPLFLFATSIPLVRYATEFKQYSSDVLITLLISLYVVSILNKKYTLKTGATFGIFGAVAIWFSFPSVFVLGGIGVTLFFAFIADKKNKEVGNLFVTFLFWWVSFILNYIFFLKAISLNASLVNYWYGSFMPLPPFTIKEQAWFTLAFLNIFYNPGMINQALIGAVAFIIGAYAICIEKKKTFFILFSPLLAVLAASSVHKYPFEGRAVLFYVPYLYLFIAAGLGFLINKKSFLPKALGIIFFISLLYPALEFSRSQMSESLVYSEDIKPALDHIKKNKQDGDVIYVYYGAYKLFKYYLDTYGLENDPYVKGIDSRDSWERYKGDIDQLKGKDRVWFVFAHVYVVNERSEVKYMIDYIDSIGKRLDSFKAYEAATYLYDLTQQKN